MRVRDLMIRHVATVNPEDGLDAAGRLMGERDCGCLTVVDDEYRAIAMLTDRDVCLAATRTDARPSRLSVKSAMSPIVVCRPDDELAQAEHLMGLHRVRRLPVVDADGRLEGLLCLDDIAGEARRERNLIVPPVSAETVGCTLGEIGRPGILGGS